MNITGWVSTLLTCKKCNLVGLYAPTSKENFDSDLPVLGDMPPSMNGVYVRVGPVSGAHMHFVCTMHFGTMNSRQLFSSIPKSTRPRCASCRILSTALLATTTGASCAHPLS